MKTTKSLESAIVLVGVMVSAGCSSTEPGDALNPSDGGSTPEVGGGGVAADGGVSSDLGTEADGGAGTALVLADDGAVRAHQ